MIETALQSIGCIIERERKNNYLGGNEHESESILQ